MAAEISNEPNSLPLVIVQGSTLSFGVVITDAAVDFTGYTARAKIIASFNALTLVKALTIVVNSAVAGSMNLTVSLTAAETAAITNVTAGERRQPIGVWDLEVVNGAGTGVTRMMQGTAFISREATT